MAEEFKEEIVLKTHLKLEKDEQQFGRIIELRENEASGSLKIRHEMKADKDGLIHNGFIFSTSSYIAAAAVNNKNGFVIGAIVHFFTPVKEGDIVEFEAKSLQKNGNKRIVDVVGKVGDIKVFVGEFTIAVMDRHILAVDLDEVATQIGGGTIEE
jgi:acyl-coenzyme A thioesterase PaaI-like protein